MTTTEDSKTESNDNQKRITKIELNQLAKTCYGESAYCEHVRTGQRGWYLFLGNNQIFLGANANDALQTLQISTQAAATNASTTDGNTSASTASAGHENKVAESVDDKKPATSGRNFLPPAEMLEILLDKFPQTFFREAENIKPVQKYIHKKIRRALDNKYSKEEISTALALYTQTPAYCQKLTEGGQRIDLNGNFCGDISPQHIEDAKARICGEKPMRSMKKKKPKLPPSPPLQPPQLDHLVAGKMELCVKINELPGHPRTVKNGWQEFFIDTQPYLVKMIIRPKTWNKLQQASHEYPLWIANIKGKLGVRYKGGFELDQPAVQIFEKKAKESKRATSPSDGTTEPNQTSDEQST
jgi:ProP effector